LFGKWVRECLCQGLGYLHCRFMSVVPVDTRGQPQTISGTVLLYKGKASYLLTLQPRPAIRILKES
jgi:hypothetical protein